jgi:hypothetical protein
MSTIAPDQTERLVQFSRRQLWYVLVTLLLLGGAMLLDTFFALNVPTGVSVAIGCCGAFCGAWRSQDMKGIDFSPANPALRAVRNDELRQAAQAKAFRNGFFVLLGYPPACAFALIGLGVPDPLAPVVASGAWLGAVTFLASLLWYDR